MKYLFITSLVLIGLKVAGVIQISILMCLMPALVGLITFGVLLLVFMVLAASDRDWETN